MEDVLPERKPRGRELPDINARIPPGDGNPLPTFVGEPERISVPDDADAFTTSLWDALDAENRISLYVRYTNLETGAEENRLINRNK